MLGTCVTIALVVVMLLGATPKAPGLKNIYYLRLDLSNATSSAFTGADTSLTNTVDNVIQTALSDMGVANYYDVGVSGYCAGTLSDGKSSNETCYTPEVPFWFDFESIVDEHLQGFKIVLPDDVQNYINVYKGCSKAMWVIYIIGAILTVLTLFSGLFSFHSKGVTICVSFLAFLAAVFIVVASAIGTAMFSIFSHYFNNEVEKYGISADVHSQGLAVTWIAAAASIWTFVWWVVAICVGSTHRRRNMAEEKQPFIGYVPQQHGNPYNYNHY